MRLAGVLVAAVVALAAAAAAMVPLALKKHRLDTPQVFQGSTSLFAVPLAGGKPKAVLRLRGQWEFPVATPDGRALYLERPSLTRTALWRVPLDGSAPTRISDLARLEQLGWSPDLSRYATDGTMSLVVDRADGTRVRTLAREDGGSLPVWSGNFISAERLLRPGSQVQRDELDVWGSDGSLLWRAKVTGPPGPAAVSPDGTRAAVISIHDLELVTAHGSRVLADDVDQPMAPVWTRDGRSVVYWDAEGRLLDRNVGSNATRVVTRGGYPGLSYGLSADGKTVYLTRLNEAVSMPK